MARMREAFGIYIQVPFCASKCTFCNFSSEVVSAAIFDPYVEALIQEIFRVAAGRCSRYFAGIEVDTIYVGGGTPSLLGAQRIKAILRLYGKFLRLRRVRNRRSRSPLGLRITLCC